MTRARKLPVWHEGEKAIQERVGVVVQMESVGQRVVRDYMPDQHREFFAQVPFVLAGSVDAAGDAWATVLEGQPGFLSSPEPTILDIAARPASADPAAEGIAAGKPIGLLGIEMHTRRRNRLNGNLAASEVGYRLEVEQSFGACPRYIQLRDFAFARAPSPAEDGAIDASAGLDAAARTMIESADTFFVASYADRDGQRQVDVSNRGGKPGFVRIGVDGTLTIPDFNGNLFFATLGNILLNGKAGLLFIDFGTGDVLQLTGTAAVVLDSPEIAAFQGAERLWTFRAHRVVRRRGALALRWTFEEDPWSPNVFMTGDWQEADRRRRAAELAETWRPFRIAKIVDEARAIRSFHLEPTDGAGILPHLAGQHLPIRLRLSGSDKAVLRTYTLSVAPSDGEYRISVKRGGLISEHLHDRLRVGDVIEARAPAGHFTIDAGEKRPAVLLAGGIGITPLLAMLKHVVYDGLRTRRIRPTTLVYAAHSKAERAFDAEIAALNGKVRVVRVLSDLENATRDIDYEASGRIDMALLKKLLAFDDYDFYVCGPAAFIQALYDGLRQLNVADDRIHAEAFGPSALVRTSSVAMRPPPATKSVPIIFTTSLKEARWAPGSGTLLQLAEERGLSPEFSCRGGSCGTCRTKWSGGPITYIKEPTAPLAEDEVLLCCAVPAEPTEETATRIELAI